MRGRTPEVFQAARELRSEMTPAEGRLWECLRQKRTAGLRFRRQHAVGRVVLDFYCPAQKLAIEVDGGVHDEPVQAERDAERTKFLVSMGIQVLRIRNEEILTDVDSVLKRIVLASKMSGTNLGAEAPGTGVPFSPPSLAGEGPGVGGSSVDAT